MFYMNRFALILAAFVPVYFLAGCGDSGPATYPVFGTVTLDGQPLEEGRIAFRDSEGKIPSAGSPIVDGKYSFRSQPGTMKVEITARREIPGEFTSPAPGVNVPVSEQYIPRRYNTSTELTKEVTEGENEFQFKLSSGGS